MYVHDMGFRQRFVVAGVLRRMGLYDVPSGNDDDGDSDDDDDAEERFRPDVDPDAAAEIFRRIGALFAAGTARLDVRVVNGTVTDADAAVRRMSEIVASADGPGRRPDRTTERRPGRNV